SELPGAELAAVCDRDPERLQAIAERHDVPAYTDHGEMLARERLDALVVAVPARLHELVALDAIGSGCAVLVEKPLATSPESGHLIIDAAQRAGVVLMPGHIERFNP